MRARFSPCPRAGKHAAFGRHNCTETIDYVHALGSNGGSIVCALAALVAAVSSAVAQEVLPTPGPAPARIGARQLTLDEARGLALQNNKGLALARMSFNEKQHAVAAAKADYFPKLLGNATYFHFNENLGDIVTVPSRGKGFLPPGGLTKEVAVFNQDSAVTTVFVAQPITKLIGVNALVQIARADRNFAQAQLDKGMRDLLSGVAQAYHGLLGAQRIQTVLELQVEMLDGLVRTRPVPELRIGLLEARQGLVQVRAQVQELTAQLNDLLDLPPCTALELVDPLPADLPGRCAEDAVRLALTHNPEVRAAEQSIAKAEAGLKAARMEYLPDVSVIGGFANQTAASYIQPDIGYVAVTGTYTFWDWRKRKQVVRQRNTQISMAHQNLEVTIDRLQLEVRKAFVSYEQAREANELAGQMVQARADAEKGAAGPAMLQVKAETAKAQLEAMKAEIVYRVAHAQLAGLLSHE